MSRERWLLAAVCVAVFLTTRAPAAELINFDTYLDSSPVPGGAPISDQWRPLGVIFSMSDKISPAFAVENYACSYSVPNHVGGDPVVIAWFVDPITGLPALTDYAGSRQDLCWGPGEGILMRAFDVNGQLIGEEFNPAAANLTTFTFAEPVIAWLEMTEFGQGIDDFTFNTPVPAYGHADMNCDGAVNGQDIDGFILALFGAPPYADYYNWGGIVNLPCHYLNADMNGDGVVNGQDIDGFVAALFGA